MLSDMPRELVLQRYLQRCIWLYQILGKMYLNSTNQASLAIPQKQNASTKKSDAFADLDPLGTGTARPFVDKKDFFLNLKTTQPTPMAGSTTTTTTTTTTADVRPSMPEVRDEVI